MTQHRAFILAFVAALAVASSFATTASAQQRGAFNQEHTLFFANLALGIGDCGGIWCGPAEGGTGPHFGLGAGIYVRPIPFFAAGFDLHMNWMSAEHEADNRFDEGASYRLGNIAVRGILPLHDVEPWLGLGFGLAGWSYGWTRDTRDEEVSVTGTDVALSAGVDVHLTDRFWLGGMFRIAVPYWDDRCREEYDFRDDRYDVECRPVETLDLEDQEELPDSLWFVGITGRVDFP